MVVSLIGLSLNLVYHKDLFLDHYYFLIYSNDLEKGIKSKINFFADDTSLFSTVTGLTLTASELNHDLKLIEQWTYLWKMSFNPDPNEQAIDSPIHPPLYFNNQEVCSAAHHNTLALS